MGRNIVDEIHGPHETKLLVHDFEALRMYMIQNDHFSNVCSHELFSIYGMRNELLRHCHIQKVSLIDGMINNRAFESMAMDRVSKGQINR